MSEITGSLETQSEPVEARGEAAADDRIEKAEGAIGEAATATQEVNAPLDVAAALEQLERSLEDGLAELQRSFEDKLAYDQAKDQQITRLHDELREHKRDLLAGAKRPLLQGLIRLHDDLGKVVASLRRQPEEEFTPERLFRVLDGFREDLELLLGQNGIETFQVPGESFDPQRQTALKTEPTTEDEKAGTIAARLRPGFSEGEALLQKERVAVYVLSRAEAAEAEAAAAEDPAAASPPVTDSPS